MPGNLLVRFDEGGVGRTARCRPLSYSTRSVNKFAPLRSRLRLGCRMFAATYRAATVRERLPEAGFPQIGKAPGSCRPLRPCYNR